MKTLFRVLALSIILTAFSTLTFAQEKDLATLFEEFKKAGPAKANCGNRDAALVIGKEIVTRFGNDELNKEVIDFVKKRMALIEKEDPACKRNNAYDAAFKAKNWPEVFTTGKAIIAAEGDAPVTLDVMLDLVSVGFDRAALEKNDTFNADTMTYAKSALAKLDAGKPSFTTKYGVFLPFNTKEEAQSWLNYIIGWQMYNKLNQQKEALPYFYKSTTVGTAKKGEVNIYTTIGGFYFDEAVKLDEQYREKRKANNNEDNDEIKAILALGRGTADRASDAYGRAYKIALADPKVPAAVKESLKKKLTDLYKFRFNLADAKQADVDKYISDLTAKPMPDPGTAVTPVIEEVKPATTTSTTDSTTPTTKEATTATKTTTKEATPTKDASTTNTATTNKATTPVKKPVTKKKGTR